MRTFKWIAFLIIVLAYVSPVVLLFCVLGAKEQPGMVLNPDSAMLINLFNSCFDKSQVVIDNYILKCTAIPQRRI